MSTAHSLMAMFATHFAPQWYIRARDPRGGVFEKLGIDGLPVEADGPKTTLTQARIVFALAHLYLVSGERRLLDAAIEVHRFLDEHLRDEDGGYRLAVAADGAPLEDPASTLRRSYDQSFALLALVTLRKTAPRAISDARVQSCWRFIDDTLTDAADGSLFEDDVMARRGVSPDDRRGQNPHMHMFEALLQAYETSGDDVWLVRADRLFAVARDRLIDPGTGAIREFVDGNLAPAAGSEGSRREPGHQYEWAWLLNRYGAFRKLDEPGRLALAMVAFADRFGLRVQGVLAGAPYEAVSADGEIVQDTHLLWPLTEAGKHHAAMAVMEPGAGHEERAGAMADLICTHFFRYEAGRPTVWVNRVDGNGAVLWPRALSRLLYHLSVFVTEGTRAGLWPTRSDERGQARTSSHVLQEENS